MCSPLLDYPISSARGVIFNIVGGPSLSLTEVIRSWYTQGGDTQTHLKIGESSSNSYALDTVKFRILSCPRRRTIMGELQFLLPIILDFRFDYTFPTVAADT